MKNFKIQFGLFSLLAILATSIFLTSCKQEEMLNETLPDTSSENLLAVEGAEFILPYGYDELSEEKKDEYLNSLDHKSFAKLVESSKVATYFAYLGKYELLENNAKYGDIYDQNTLVSHLTTDEVVDFSSTDSSSIIESRWGCGEWKDINGICFLKNNNFRYSCWCYDVSWQKKQKKVCDNWFDKYRWVDC